MNAMLVPARAFFATARSATVLGACLSAQRSAARGTTRRREDDGGSGSPARLRTDGASCSTCITARARGESARLAAAARAATWALLRAASPRAGPHMRAGSQSAAQQVAAQRGEAEAVRGRGARCSASAHGARTSATRPACAQRTRATRLHNHEVVVVVAVQQQRRAANRARRGHGRCRFFTRAPSCDARGRLARR